jgi:CRISPR-associated protein Cas6
MYWQDRTDNKPYVVPDDILDLAFGISCRSLPVDHAHALSQALVRALPWLAQEERAGVHLIHGAESSHGWQRPSDPDTDVLYLSRRTKLTLRLPKERIGDAQALTGTTLEVAGSRLELRAATVRPLSAITTLQARYVVAPEQTPEEQFLNETAEELARMGIVARKLLCGRSAVFRVPEGRLFTRRLMVADLTPEESVRLQQLGLGAGRKMGCGLFIPHKGIVAVNASDES